MTQGRQEKELNLPDCISVEEFDKISNHGIIPKGYFLCTECYLYISKEMVCPHCEEINFHTKNKSLSQVMKDYDTPTPIIKQLELEVEGQISEYGKFTKKYSHKLSIRRKYDSLTFIIPENISTKLANEIMIALKKVLKDVDDREKRKVHEGIKNYLLPQLKLLSKIDRIHDYMKYRSVYSMVLKKVMFLFDPKFMFRFGLIQNKYVSKKPKEFLKINYNDHLKQLVEYASEERKITKSQFVREILYEYFEKAGYIK